jgi:hypothetical protein
MFETTNKLPSMLWGYWRFLFDLKHGARKSATPKKDTRNWGSNNDSERRFNGHPRQKIISLLEVARFGLRNFQVKIDVLFGGGSKPYPLGSFGGCFPPFVQYSSFSSFSSFLVVTHPLPCIVHYS